MGGEPFILNAELIQYVEARPDTFITLTTGQRLVVAEAMDEVLRRTMVYQQAKHLLPLAAAAQDQRRRSDRWPRGAGDGQRNVTNGINRPCEARERSFFPRLLPKDNLELRDPNHTVRYSRFLRVADLTGGEETARAADRRPA